jgi:hypothetical protein
MNFEITFVLSVRYNSTSSVGSAGGPVRGLAGGIVRFFAAATDAQRAGSPATLILNPVKLPPDCTPRGPDFVLFQC